MCLLHIQGSLEVHRELFLCLLFACHFLLGAWKMRVDLRRDEHKEVRVEAREAVGWSDQFKDSEIWHNVEG